MSLGKAPALPTSLFSATYSQFCIKRAVSPKLRVTSLTPSFLLKCLLKLDKPFSGQSGYKEPKMPKKTQNAVYRSRALWPSILDAKYQVLKFGHAQKAKFRD